MSENNNSISKPEENEEKQSFRINIDSHEAFDRGIQTTFLTSIDLCQKISMIFGEVFSDYTGCKIKVYDGKDPQFGRYVGQPGTPYVELYFKDMPEADNGLLKCIHPKDGKNGTSDNYGDRLLNSMSYMSMAKHYVVDKEIKDACTPYIPVNGKIQWEYLINEVPEGMTPYSMAKREILVCISGLSLRRLIEDMYGTKDENGTYEYMISIVSSIMLNTNTGMDQGFVFSINRLDHGLINKLERTFGTVRTPGGFYQFNR